MADNASSSARPRHRGNAWEKFPEDAELARARAFETSAPAGIIKNDPLRARDEQTRDDIRIKHVSWDDNVIGDQKTQGQAPGDCSSPSLPKQSHGGQSAGTERKSHGLKRSQLSTAPKQPMDSSNNAPGQPQLNISRTTRSGFPKDGISDIPRESVSARRPPRHDATLRDSIEQVREPTSGQQVSTTAPSSANENTKRPYREMDRYRAENFDAVEYFDGNGVDLFDDVKGELRADLFTRMFNKPLNGKEWGVVVQRDELQGIQGVPADFLSADTYVFCDDHNNSGQNIHLMHNEDYSRKITLDISERNPAVHALTERIKWEVRQDIFRSIRIDDFESEHHAGMQNVRPILEAAAKTTSTGKEWETQQEILKVTRMFPDSLDDDASGLSNSGIRSQVFVSLLENPPPNREWEAQQGILDAFGSFGKPFVSERAKQRFKEREDRYNILEAMATHLPPSNAWEAQQEILRRLDQLSEVVGKHASMHGKILKILAQNPPFGKKIESQKVIGESAKEFDRINGTNRMFSYISGVFRKLNRQASENEPDKVLSSRHVGANRHGEGSNVADNAPSSAMPRSRPRKTSAHEGDGFAHAPSNDRGDGTQRRSRTSNAPNPKPKWYSQIVGAARDLISKVALMRYGSAAAELQRIDDAYSAGRLRATDLQRAERKADRRYDDLPKALKKEARRNASTPEKAKHAIRTAYDTVVRFPNDLNRGALELALTASYNRHRTSYKKELKLNLRRAFGLTSKDGIRSPGESRHRNERSRGHKREEVAPSVRSPRNPAPLEPCRLYFDMLPGAHRDRGYLVTIDMLDENNLPPHDFYHSSSVSKHTIDRKKYESRLVPAPDNWAYVEMERDHTGHLTRARRTGEVPRAGLSTSTQSEQLRRAQSSAAGPSSHRGDAGGITAPSGSGTQTSRREYDDGRRR